LRDVRSFGSLTNGIGVAVPIYEISIRTVDGIPIIVRSQFGVVKVRRITTIRHHDRTRLEIVECAKEADFGVIVDVIDQSGNSCQMID
jgi:hypothetical protein